MAARDIFHQAVRKALEKEEWTITDDPLLVQFGGVDLYIDLGAERLLGAEKDGERIAVEVKSFLSDSPITDFHAALGQFLNYRFALSQDEPDRILYLAVPLEAYKTFFALPFTQGIVKNHQLNLLVYNADLEEIAQWIS
ncbi:MAG: element excision factor XisH family protein [Chloroflexota bacterium]